MKVDIEKFVDWARGKTEGSPGHGGEPDMLWVIAQALTIIAAELDEIIKEVREW